MKKEEIHLWDIKRILFGQAPPEFLLEVFIRTLIVYILTIVVVRLMGKRMGGQISIIEISVMVMMGAIISVPMQLPDRGVIQGIFVLFLALFFLRAVNWLSFKSPTLDKIVQGEVMILVKDGVLQVDNLSQTHITHQNVFGILRTKKIYNLGKVKRMYIEANGSFSIYQEEKPKPGLSVFPQIDETIYEGYQQTSPNEKACIYCGKVQATDTKNCLNCGHDEWAKAII